MGRTNLTQMLWNILLIIGVMLIILFFTKSYLGIDMPSEGINEKESIPFEVTNESESAVNISKYPIDSKYPLLDCSELKEEPEDFFGKNLSVIGNIKEISRNDHIVFGDCKIAIDEGFSNLNRECKNRPKVMLKGLFSKYGGDNYDYLIQATDCIVLEE